MNNLLCYPHGEDAAWDTYVAATRSEVAAVLAKCMGGELDPNPSGYFNRIM